MVVSRDHSKASSWFGSRTSRLLAAFWLGLLAPVFLAEAVPAETSDGSIAYTRYKGGGDNIKKVPYSYDGATLTIGAPVPLAEVDGANGIIRLPGGTLLVGGQADWVHHIEPDGSGDHETLPAGGTSAHHLTLDPDGHRAWAGGAPGAPAEIPLEPFSEGIVRTVTGDDRAITQITFDATGRAFYTTGAFEGWGNFGTIDMRSFRTTRLIENLEAAHGMTYDPYTGDLLLFGGNEIAQIDPDAPTRVKSNLYVNLGSQFDVGRADGKGHLFATRNDGYLVFVDYAESGLVGESRGAPRISYLDSYIDDLTLLPPDEEAEEEEPPENAEEPPPPQEAGEDTPPPSGDKQGKPPETPPSNSPAAPSGGGAANASVPPPVEAGGEEPPPPGPGATPVVATALATAAAVALAVATVLAIAAVPGAPLAATVMAAASAGLGASAGEAAYAGFTDMANAPDLSTAAIILAAALGFTQLGAQVAKASVAAAAGGALPAGAALAGGPGPVDLAGADMVTPETPPLSGSPEAGAGAETASSGAEEAAANSDATGPTEGGGQSDGTNSADDATEDPDKGEENISSDEEEALIDEADVASGGGFLPLLAAFRKRKEKGGKGKKKRGENDSAPSGAAADAGDATAPSSPEPMPAADTASDPAADPASAPAGTPIENVAPSAPSPVAAAVANTRLAKSARSVKKKARALKTKAGAGVSAVVKRLFGERGLSILKRSGRYALDDIKNMRTGLDKRKAHAASEGEEEAEAPPETDLSMTADEIIAQLRAANPDREVTVDIAPSIIAAAPLGVLRPVMRAFITQAWERTADVDNARITFGARAAGGKIVYFVRDNASPPAKVDDGEWAWPETAEPDGGSDRLKAAEQMVKRLGGSMWAQPTQAGGAALVFSLDASG
jgi:hypothetical protein